MIIKKIINSIRLRRISKNINFLNFNTKGFMQIFDNLNLKFDFQKYIYIVKKFIID